MTDEIVTLETYTYPTEAYPLISKLESEGIKCFLDDENTVSVHPFLSNAIGGVNLNIRKRDLDNKDEITKEYYLVNNTCSKCSSVKVYRKRQPVLFTILKIIFLIPILFSKKQYYCFDCNNEWMK